MTKTITIPSEVHQADVIYMSHSGGKDSQAALSVLKRLGFLGKVFVVHADLGEMEWEEMKPWIQEISFGLPVHVVQSEMSFFDMARKYKRLPSGQQQFCTDFLKCQPIEAWIHAHMTENGFKTAINVTGMRAEESKRRAEKDSFQVSDMQRPRKFPDHKIFDWLPIFDFSTIDVFAEIASCGQEPHVIYSMGFSRLSCVFCVNGRIEEHKQAAILRPLLAQKMADLERELGKSIRLKQVKGIKSPKYLDEYVTISNPFTCN